MYWTLIQCTFQTPLGVSFAPYRRHAYHALSNFKSYDILHFGVSIALLPHRNILVFSSSTSIKLPIMRYRCSGEENPPLSSFLYTNSDFRSICSIYIHVFLDKEFSSLSGPSNSARKCTQKSLFRVSFSLPFPTSNSNPYRMLKQYEGSMKRKRPHKGSFLDNTTCVSVRIMDNFAINEFRRDFNIPNNVNIQLLCNTTPLPTNTHKKNSMCFTRKQFHVRLRLPLPSLVRKFLHYTQILSSFIHSNSI